MLKVPGVRLVWVDDSVGVRVLPLKVMLLVRVGVPLVAVRVVV